MIRKIKAFITETFDLNVSPIDIITTAGGFALMLGAYYIACLLDLITK